MLTTQHTLNLRTICRSQTQYILSCSATNLNTHYSLKFIQHVKNTWLKNVTKVFWHNITKPRLCSQNDQYEFWNLSEVSKIIHVTLFRHKSQDHNAYRLSIPISRFKEPKPCKKWTISTWQTPVFQPVAPFSYPQFTWFSRCHIAQPANPIIFSLLDGFSYTRFLRLVCNISIQIII